MASRSSISHGRRVSSLIVYVFDAFHTHGQKDALPLGVLTSNFISWSQKHGDALHVLWTDEDNDRLVKEHYQDFQALYFNTLLSKVQRSDIARIMYLHRYGGVYVDLDYEARENLFAHLPDTKAEILIVRSPTMLQAVMQNSLMIAKAPKQEFWTKVLLSTAETISSIDNPPECSKDPQSGCDDFGMFRNPVTQKIANVIFSGFMTGPAVLDRTVSLYQNPSWRVELLPLKEFFVGSIAKHYQLSTWRSLLSVVRELILVGVVAIICSFAAGALMMRWYLVDKIERKKARYELSKK
jgi:hypothetical protein